MRHAFVHFDLDTSAFAEVRRFYEALFDWAFIDVDMGAAPYAQIRPPSGPGGGMQPVAKPSMSSKWVPYVGVDDVRAMLERVRAAGGTVIMGYTPVPGYGAQAIVQDPGGTQLGLWEMVVVEPEPEPEPEVVEAEIIEDAVVVEQVLEPATKGRKKKAGTTTIVVPVETTPLVVEQAPPRAVANKKGGSKATKKASMEAPVVEVAPVETPSAKKASTKKASTKKASAKKASTKKASTKKTSAKKTSAKKASAKKASAKKAPAKKASAKKAPAKKAPARR